jgi:type II secretory pathway predicted ATPase ExeA
MYYPHYGLAEEPFNLKPDLKFVYLTPDNERKRSALVAEIQERDGLIVVIGEPGVGKSMLVETALSSTPQDVHVARVLGSATSFEEMIAVVLFNLGLMKPDEALSQPEAINRLANAATELYADKISIVVFIKEAQGLDLYFLKNLRHLYELEVRGQKLVQIVLCGQPELEEKLSNPEMLWLKGRKIHWFDLEPLTEAETYEYIQHRLAMADYQGSELFKPDALELIWEYSAGVPEKINRICHQALVIGYFRGRKHIKKETVEVAIKKNKEAPTSGAFETSVPVPSEPPPSPPSESKRLHLLRPALTVLLGIACVALAGTIYYSIPHRSEEKNFIRSVIIRPPVQKNLQRFVDSAGKLISDAPPQRNDAKKSLEPDEYEQKDDSQRASITALAKESEKAAEMPQQPKLAGINNDNRGEPKGKIEGENKQADEKADRAEKPVTAALPPVSRQKGDEKKASETTPPPTSQDPIGLSGTVVIQVGSYRYRSEALKLIDKLEGVGFQDLYMEEAIIQGKGIFYRVRLRGFASISETQKEIAKLNKLGYTDLFIEDLAKK